MVMETPSAQCVGREFVRQYYTLLHEAPDYLHRFYSHNSCFVHGGVEKPGEEQPPVMGQTEIHKKIMSLKFRDCHAKIRQVDSQPTVANAVVVQVTGELSNNRQPMRRFMQTFLLAPQSPKKYYVHNDIFRYQDEVFHDIESDTADELNTAELDQDLSEHPEIPPDAAAVPFFEQPPTTISNGASEERPETPEEPKQPDVPEPEQEPFEDAKEETVPETEVDPEPVPEPQPQEAQKPKSWADLAGAKVQQPPQPQQPPPMNRIAPVKPAPMKPAEVKPADKPQGQRVPRPPRRDTSRSSVPPAPGSTEDDRRKSYPDTHQLFVGNLPHNIDEPELKDFFEENYGKVVDVRINRKSSANRDVPNFGFVVFLSAETVSKVLDMKPIMLRNDIRLNVEEKKQRGEQGVRPGSGTRMGRGGSAPSGMMAGRGGAPRGGRGGAARSDRGRGGGESRGGGFNARAR